MKVLVIGASNNPERYSYKAIAALLSNGHQVFALGNRVANVSGITIETEKKQLTDIHTVTLYINNKIQSEYYDYILALNPKRVIFNPGTENPELESLLKKNNIEAIEACTLVMLATNQF